MKIARFCLLAITFGSILLALSGAMDKAIYCILLAIVFGIIDVVTTLNKRLPGR